LPSTRQSAPWSTTAFKGNGNAIFATANGGIGIGKISSKIPRSIVTQVYAVKAKLAAGKIKNIPTTP